MEQDTLYFLILIAVILAANGALFYVDYRGDLAMQQDYNAKMATISGRLDAIRQEYDNRINQQTLQISSLVDRILLETEAVKQELQGEVQGIQTSIRQTKQESEEKLLRLESQLLNLNIQSQDFTTIIEDIIDAVVSVDVPDGGGSGVIVDQEGYVITNYHVIQGSSAISILTFDKKLYPARLVGFNQKHDIAVLKIEGSDFERMKFGNSNHVQIGQKVIALGSPGGLDFTVTEGIVSAKRTDSVGRNYLQTDVPVNPGSSGGPLVDAAGRIIGINQIKIKEFEGIGFAIAVNDIDDIVDEMVERDKGNR